MGAKEFMVLTFALLGIIAVSQASQYYGRMRGLNNIYKDHCTCTCEDIASLIALARVLEEKELCGTSPAPPPPPPPPPSNPTPYLSNFEELIMKLVNALVYTATETTKNSCCCSHSAPVTVPPTPPTPTPTTGTQNSYSDGGLINVDLLNSNKNSNVLDLDVGNTHVVGVGLGGSSTGQHPTGQTPSGQNTNNPNSGGGLVNLDLLNSRKPDNVAELDLGNEKLLGVGLGGGGGAPNPNPNPNNGNTKPPPNNPPSNSSPSSGEGLINLDLLNPKNEHNVADLDLNGKDLVGVGLGNH